MEMGETWPETQELPFQLKKKERKDKGIAQKIKPKPLPPSFQPFLEEKN